MRYVVAIFVFCLPVVAAHAGTYVETFDDGDFDGWEICDYGMPGSEWKVENGVLTCMRRELFGSSLVFGEQEWRNYSIECDGKLLVEGLPISQFDSIGLDLRVSDCNNFSNFSDVWCIASKTSRTAFIWPFLNGKELRGIPGPGFNLEWNRWYRFKGIANEDDFEFYIDGELVDSLSESRIPTGRVGVIVQGIAHFDNIVITGDDIPGNIAAVSTSGKLATTWGQLRSR